jgi:protein SCO1/2
MSTHKHLNKMILKSNTAFAFCTKTLRRKGFGFAGLCLLFSLVSCNSPKKEEKAALLLPVYGPKKAIAEGDTTYHTIGDFSFTNQYKETISQRNTTGKIYIADFFFATCQNICPAMSTQLIRVQDAIKNDNDILILSHTVNPVHDTVEVLFEYAGKYKAIKDKWHFLTGNKKDINSLAEKSYLVSAQDDGTPEGFVHSEKFLLVDKQRRIRGVYDGTDSLQVDKLIKDILILKKEK